MITIISYCDTIEKKEHLKNLILSIKEKKPVEEILVYSHYQDLEPEWWAGANYYIFDHTNPKSNKSFASWTIIPPQKKKFFRWGDDWGFSVLQMIKRSSLFLLDIGFTKTTIINYDVHPDEVESIIFPELQEGEIGAFCNWSTNQNQINLTYMHLDLLKIERDFFESITWDNYHSYDTSKIPEEIFHDMLNSKFNGSWKKINSLRTTFSGAERHLEEGHPLRKYFSTVLPTRNNFHGNNHKCLSIWNCTSKVSKIEIQIEGINFTLFNEIDGDNSQVSFFSHLPGGVEINKISILKINDDQIPPYIIEGLDENYWAKNYHEPHL